MGFKMKKEAITVPLLGLFGTTIAQQYGNTSSAQVPVHWLGSTPNINTGTTFGLPWAKGEYFPNSTYLSIDGERDSQSWVTGYWKDGSIKWSAHALAASDSPQDTYTVTANAGASSASSSSRDLVAESDTEITVDTGNLTAVFPRSGNTVVNSITTGSGKLVGQNGKLVLNSQSAIPGDVENRTSSAIDYFNFESSIDNVTVSSGSARALVTMRGSHHLTSSGEHDDWLPFVLRFYLYANSDAMRVIHTLVFDGAANEDFITGVGIRFQVPLEGEELYNRHIRLSGVDDGLLSEAVQGITGLRRDPGEEIRNAQFEGRETPDISTWDERVSSRMQWIPTWNDYSLEQLSPDGFTLKKRTEAGQSWLKIPGSTRSGGLAYLGGATEGGLAVGLRDFWQRYPTGLDIRNAATEMGEITVWIYSPAAEPLDLRPYHGLMGLDTYEEQLDALEITYEDYEPGFATPFGIARTNEIFIYAFDSTPPQDNLAEMAHHMNNPPVLYTEPEYVDETDALGTYWSPPRANATGLEARIEENMDFLYEFYQLQKEQHKWYGFLDYGDFMHTYDVDRHQWRYDIGGYAWDNSELSPDLFFWNYFLRTGREDVYRFAEALTRHTGEVDVYHIGQWKALGTRHGVQHYFDSAKQARISTAQYRKIFYYVSGGDERVGELLDETLDTDQTYQILDPNRKVREDDWEPTPGQTATIGLGTDWSALSASWLMEWERRGSRWEEARMKLTNTMKGIASLENGFITGSALYNSTDGTLDPPPTDPNNTGIVSVSHLSGVFGMMEVIVEAIDYFGDDLPEGFEQAWLDYCYYYRAPSAEQEARYGDTWSGTLRQGHSRLLAWAANWTQNATLAERAWSEFQADGLDTTEDWTPTRLNGSEVLAPVDELTLMSTNEMSLYGIASIVNLAFIPEYLPESFD